MFMSECLPNVTYLYCTSKQTQGVVTYKRAIGPVFGTAQAATVNLKFWVSSLEFAFSFAPFTMTPNLHSD